MDIYLINPEKKCHFVLDEVKQPDLVELLGARLNVDLKGAECVTVDFQSDKKIQLILKSSGKESSYELKSTETLQEIAKSTDLLFAQAIGGVSRSLNELAYFFSLSPKQMQEIKSYSESKVPFSWKAFVVNHERIASFYDKVPDSQVKYGDMMAKAVFIGTGLMTEKKWDFNALLEFFAAQRGSIAFHLNHADSHEYGKLRESAYDTFCNGGYGVLSKFFSDQAELISKGVGSVKGLKYIKSPPQLIVTGTIKSEEVELSTIKFDEYNPKRPVSYTNFATIVHTDPKHRLTILKHVETLFKESIEEENPKILMEKLGMIYWWICQAKPWEMGDPSIVEMLIRSIISAKNLEMQPWKPGVIPWLEVMKETDVDKFAENFHTLFEKI